MIEEPKGLYPVTIWAIDRNRFVTVHPRGIGEY